MTKHKHAEMIKAKADNIELIVFSERDGAWDACVGFPSWFKNRDYFLCLPKHKKECLRWLNGGEIQWSDDIHGWSDKNNYADDLKSQEFFYGNAFMLDDNKFRIKSKKEKRWIIVFPNDNETCGILYNSKSVAQTQYPLAGDECFIEIEVEV
jgi:hypothetical protein